MEARLTLATLAPFFLASGGCFLLIAGGCSGGMPVTQHGGDNTSDDLNFAPPACVPVMASSFNQSCTSNSDCVAVTDPESCCPGVAINGTAQAQYMAAASQAAANGCTSARACTGSCGIALPCCIGGKCEIGATDTCEGGGPDAGDGGVADTGVDVATDAAADASASDAADAAGE